MEALQSWRAEALRCSACHGLGLVHRESDARAPPLFDKHLDGSAGVLVVAEAPNWDDTYDPAKGYLTYDRDTDPTGTFAVHLLHDVAGLAVEEVIFTNAVLCLPRCRTASTGSVRRRRRRAPHC
jgi:uracil-DNA glycosylase